MLCSSRNVPRCISVLTLKFLPYCFSMVPMWVSLRLSRNNPFKLRVRYPLMPGASCFFGINSLLLMVNYIRRLDHLVLIPLFTACCITVTQIRAIEIIPKSFKAVPRFLYNFSNHDCLVNNNFLMEWITLLAFLCPEGIMSLLWKKEI